MRKCCEEYEDALADLKALPATPERDRLIVRVTDWYEEHVDAAAEANDYE